MDSSMVHLSSGARYSDATNTWEPLAASPLSARQSADVVWTGTHMFLHGGSGAVANWSLTDGALYDPAKDSWTALPEGGGARGAGATVWTGCDVLEVGGFSSGDNNKAASTGMRYTPSTKTWSELPALPTRFLGNYDGAVWAGDQLVVYGSGGNQVGSMFAYRLVQ
jgi:N-acetylneuraminic acid mutarotase